MCTILFISTSGLSGSDAFFTYQIKLLHSKTIVSVLPSDIIIYTAHCTLRRITCFVIYVYVNEMCTPYYYYVYKVRLTARYCATNY